MDLGALEIEIKKGLSTLENLENIVTIFGGARVGRDTKAYQSVRKLARRLGKEGYSVMTGGGPGIMEAANRGLVEYKNDLKNGKLDKKRCKIEFQRNEQSAKNASLQPAKDSIISIGLNIQLPHEQQMNPFVEVPLEFQNFFSRKLVFNYNSTAFVVAMGGFGTLDELSEVLVQIATGKHKRIPIILYGKDYWRGFVQWLRSTMLKESTISKDELELIQIANKPKEVLKILKENQK
ncbi:TIGR00730 family Rossman fold protein [Helicobacter sp. MIT 05-5294]|uniref:LOG family protein n=1 Tax=Helicobacter sp. MIT 05-5294 TaxID=1548150 RepID=UPI00051FA29E|nr:TIGR00730 family Rossman fold protein [Helicobacter sp. MIT 05-5294]TLD86544.1 TIGR00730 family Rossman fold protein [Helicobacter sp. MIT 05-5294]